MNKKYKYNINEVIKEVNEMDIWMCSYGGSCSGWIRKNLEKKYKMRTMIWDKKLCHFNRPINNLNIKCAIYVYANPLNAIISIIRRDILNKNYYKILDFNDTVKTPSIKKYLLKMIEQMNNWKNSKVNYPVILIKVDKIEKNINKLFNYLETDITVPFINRKTDAKKIKKYYKKFNFESKKKTLNQVINEYKKMPDFKIILPNDYLL